MGKLRGRSDSKSKSKGKRKAAKSPSPTLSPEKASESHPGSDGDAPPPSQIRRGKKKRQSSPSPDQTKVHGAHGPGLAAFAALVSKHEGLKTARQETNTGLTKKKSASGSSGLTTKGKASLDKDAFRVGKIIFLTAGIKTTETDLTGGVLQPVYATITEVDVSQSALVSLIQYGLCIVKEDGFPFNRSDTYDTINDELERQFPFLFRYFSSPAYNIDPDSFEATLSPWLVCMKRSGHQPGVLVYSTDAALPNGMDVYTASHIKNRASYTEITLFLVTRHPISLDVVLSWITDSNPDLERYRATLVRDTADADGSDNESSLPDPGIGVAGPGPSSSTHHSSVYTFRSRSKKYWRPAVWEADESIISISSDDDSDYQPNSYRHDSPTPTGRNLSTPSPSVIPSQSRVPTPPVVEAEPMEDIFNSSMLLDPDADWVNRSHDLE